MAANRSGEGVSRCVEDSLQGPSKDTLMRSIESSIGRHKCNTAVKNTESMPPENSTPTGLVDDNVPLASIFWSVLDMS
jgi:hypothetical protein